MSPRSWFQVVAMLNLPGLAVGHMFGLGMAMPDDMPGRHLGVDMAALSACLNAQPAAP